MCSPTVSLGGNLLGAALGGFGSSLSQQAGQVSAARNAYAQQLAENEILRRQTENEAKARAAEAVLQYQQIQLAEQEANASATMEKQDRVRELQKARALTKLTALEGGVSGNVIDRAMVDLGFVENKKMEAIETSRESAIDQLEGEKIATYLSAKTQPVYTSIGEPPKFGAMNFLSAALGGLTGFISAGGFEKKSTPVKVSEAASYSTYNSRFR